MGDDKTIYNFSARELKPKMRKPPLARCMSFFAVVVGTQPLSGGETAITAFEKV